MSSEGGANRDVGRLAIADLADHDHVGVLTNDVTQAGGKGQADLGIHVNLIDTVHLVLDGILDGDDLLVGEVDALQGRVERGGLAGTGGSGDEKNAVGQRGVILHAPEHAFVKTQAAEIVEVARRAVEQTHDDAFAIECGQRRDAQIDFAAEHLDLDAAVLRQAALGDVELRHQLDARDHGGLHVARGSFLFLQYAVHAEADPELLLERFNVDIGSALLRGGRDHRVHQANDGRFARHVAELLEIGGSFGVVARVEVVILLCGFAVVAVDGFEDLALGGERRTDLESGRGLHGGDGFEIIRIGHGENERAVIHRHGKTTKLP